LDLSGVLAFTVLLAVRAVLNESSVYPISDGCNFSGGSSNGTSVNSGVCCFLTALSFLPALRE
jgi:hypothetical protein